MLAGIRKFAFVAALLAVGCTSMPYSPPVVEPMAGATAPFAGLRGIAKDSPLKLLVVHGMCSKDFRWVSGWTQALGETFESEAEHLSTAYVGLIQTALYGFVDRGRRVEATFVLWSPANDEAKRALDYDKTADFPFERADFNAAGKDELINDCISDAVIYSGSRAPGTAGAAIRRDMRGIICKFLGGTWRDPACSDVQPSADVAIITESLGSKITFDAIDALVKGRASDRAAIQAALQRTASIYMLANQLPLLGLAEAREPARSTTSTARIPLVPGLDWVGPAAGSRPLASDQKLQIVAFTDPNDLLSYRLTHAAIGQSPDRVTLFNVIVSNDKTWFGKAENPATAHTGYWNNHAARTMLLDAGE